MRETATFPEGAVVASSDGVRTNLLVEEWSLDRDFETIRTERTPLVPDENWVGEHRGHQHTWLYVLDEDDHPSTVTRARQERRHVDCDGTCGGVCEGEGYDVTVWVCRVTGEDIEPGTKPDPRGNTRQVLRTETLTLTVSGEELPQTIENARVEIDVTEGPNQGLHVMDLPKVMRCCETTFGDGPTRATYTGGPMPRD